MATVAALLATDVLATAQARRPAQAVDNGRGLLLVYCASCHRPEGQGNGPAADELCRRPTDLTKLAKNNGRIFDDLRIYRAVDGQLVNSHGSVDMPVWGDVFKQRLGLDDEAVRERISHALRRAEELPSDGGARRAEGVIAPIRPLFLDWVEFALLLAREQTSPSKRKAARTPAPFTTTLSPINRPS